MEKVLIIGGKGTAVNIAEQIIEANEKYNNSQHLAGFLIDAPELGDSINGIPIIGKTSEAAFWVAKGYKLLFALYKPEKMHERVKLLQSYNLDISCFTKFIHPTAYIAASSSVGNGSIILNGATIHSNCNIGNFNVINSNCVFEHDSQVAKYNFFAAQTLIGAAVKIANGNFFGLGAKTREHINVGNYNFIGMGALLLKDLENHKLTFGIPAKIKGIN